MLQFVKEYFVLALAVAGLTMMSLPAPAGKKPVLEGHTRPADNSFLTYPEWFLVYSSKEFADFVAKKRPSNFPYYGHLKQFWTSYNAVNNELKGKHPFNGEYHLMIWVIGVSTSVEYMVKSFYETVIGRFTESIRGKKETPEEVFATHFATHYVNSLYTAPWYLYDFWGKCKELWSKTPMWGPDLLRKWERRYTLTTELLFKAGYGWFLKKNIQAGPIITRLTTTIVVDKLPSNVRKKLPKLKVLKRNPDGSIRIIVPRYQPFTDYAITLAQHGVHFRTIAGNANPILVTFLVKNSWKAPTKPPYKIVFRQTVMTNPSLKRVAIAAVVPKLAFVLKSLYGKVESIEHIYDF